MKPTVTITLGVDAMNMVLNLLGTHPFNQVAELVMDIRQQAQTQLNQLQQSPPSGTEVLYPRGNGEDRPKPAA